MNEIKIYMSEALDKLASQVPEGQLVTSVRASWNGRDGIATASATVRLHVTAGPGLFNADTGERHNSLTQNAVLHQTQKNRRRYLNDDQR
jgi:hypothetical protein